MILAVSVRSFASLSSLADAFAPSDHFASLSAADSSAMLSFCTHGFTARGSPVLFTGCERPANSDDVAMEAAAEEVKCGV